MFDILFDDETTKLYYIRFSQIQCLDREIAEIIGLSESEYKKIMNNDFHCIRDKKSDETFFPTKEETDKAMEWLESMYLMKQMSKSTNR